MQFMRGGFVVFAKGAGSSVPDAICRRQGLQSSLESRSGLLLYKTLRELLEISLAREGHLFAFSCFTSFPYFFALQLLGFSSFRKVADEIASSGLLQLFLIFVKVGQFAGSCVRMLNGCVRMRGQTGTHVYLVGRHVRVYSIILFTCVRVRFQACAHLVTRWYT